MLCTPYSVLCTLYLHCCDPCPVPVLCTLYHAPCALYSVHNYISMYIAIKYAHPPQCAEGIIYNSFEAEVDTMNNCTGGGVSATRLEKLHVCVVVQMYRVSMIYHIIMYR